MELKQFARFIPGQGPIGIPLAVLFGLSLTLSSQGGTITWGGAIGDINVDSGAKPIDGGFTFQLGRFLDKSSGDAFDPQVDSFNLWEDHWVAFDESTYSFVEINGQPTNFGLYTGGARLQPDLTSDSTRIPQQDPSSTFSPGDQAYIWGYNKKAIDTDTEWILVTNDSSDGESEDDWLFPTPSTHSPETIQMRISGASTAVWGSLGDFRNDDGTSPEIIGQGSFSSRLDSYSIQTHGLFATTIPEPGTALLLILGGFLSIIRRSRRE